MRIPPLRITIMLEPNLLKSRILVRRLAVGSLCLLLISSIAAEAMSQGPPETGASEFSFPKSIFIQYVFLYYLFYVCVILITMTHILFFFFYHFFFYGRLGALGTPAALLEPLQGPLGRLGGEVPHLGDSKKTVRGYCLDFPRFEESLDNQKQTKQTHSRNKVSDSKNGQAVSSKSPIASTHRASGGAAGSPPWSAPGAAAASDKQIRSRKDNEIKGRQGNPNIICNMECEQTTVQYQQPKQE